MGGCVLSRLSRVRLFATLWTVACQSPLAMGFSRQEYWSGLSCSPLGDLPDPGIEPPSPASRADSLRTEPPLGKALPCFMKIKLDTLLALGPLPEASFMQHEEPMSADTQP